MRTDDDLAGRVRYYALGLADQTQPVSVAQIAAHRARATPRHHRRIVPVAVAALTAAALLAAAVTIAQSRSAHPAPPAAAPVVVPMAASPLAGRSTFSSVWTGREFLVWGGAAFDNHPFADGAAYNPRTNHWRRIARSPLGARQGAATVWTGDAMFVWGGFDPRHNRWYTDGALYNPTTDHWTKISNAPIRGRELAAAVWTGREVIVLGGFWGPVLSDGATFDPGTDRWRRLPPAPIATEFSPSPNVTWNGRELIVASFASPNRADSPGTNPVSLAAYLPATNTWQQLPSVAQGVVQLFWTRDTLLLLCPFANAGSVALIGAEQRRQLARPSAPLTNEMGAAWTGDEAIFVGLDHSLVYDPGKNTWRRLPPIEISQRAASAIVWANGELIIWGGLSQREPQQTLNDGVLYRPPRSG